jgi:hypothetical protein
MAYLAATDVTLAGKFNKLGKKKMFEAALTFGDGALQYPAGGIPLPAIGRFGMYTAPDMVISQPDISGIIWKYDKTNHKLKAYHRAPVVVFEEVVALTDNLTGTTKYPMAWPLYASNADQALGLLPAGLTPVTTTIAINMHSATPGTRATITAKATDSYSTITISYITQAWAEVFENLVEAETMTAGATTTKGITFTAGTPDIISFITAAPFLCGLMVGLNLNGTISCPKPLGKAQTGAAGEYALDWTNTDPVATTMAILTGNNWNAATASIIFNYLKKPAAGFLSDRFVEEEAISASGQVATHAAGGNVLQPLLWATPGFMPSVTVSTTSATWPIGGTGMTLGATAQWKPTNFYPKQKLVTAGTWTSGTGVLATLAVKPSYIWGVPEDIDCIVPLEMPNGVVLKNRSIRAMVWGN